eukprot:g3945.t1
MTRKKTEVHISKAIEMANEASVAASAAANLAASTAEGCWKDALAQHKAEVAEHTEIAWQSARGTLSVMRLNVLGKQRAETREAAQIAAEEAAAAKRELQNRVRLSWKKSRVLERVSTKMRIAGREYFERYTTATSRAAAIALIAASAAKVAESDAVTAWLDAVEKQKALVVTHAQDAWEMARGILPATRLAVLGRKRAEAREVAKKARKEAADKQQRHVQTVKEHAKKGWILLREFSLSKMHLVVAGHDNEARRNKAISVAAAAALMAASEADIAAKKAEKEWKTAIQEHTEAVAKCAKRALSRSKTILTASRFKQMGRKQKEMRKRAEDERAAAEKRHYESVKRHAKEGWKILKMHHIVCQRMARAGQDYYLQRKNSTSKAALVAALGASAARVAASDGEKIWKAALAEEKKKIEQRANAMWKRAKGAVSAERLLRLSRDHDEALEVAKRAKSNARDAAKINCRVLQEYKDLKKSAAARSRFGVNGVEEFPEHHKKLVVQSVARKAATKANEIYHRKKVVKSLAQKAASKAKKISNIEDANQIKKVSVFKGTETTKAASKSGTKVQAKETTSCEISEIAKAALKAADAALAAAWSANLAAVDADREWKVAALENTCERNEESALETIHREEVLKRCQRFFPNNGEGTCSVQQMLSIGRWVWPKFQSSGWKNKKGKYLKQIEIDELQDALLMRCIRMKDKQMSFHDFSKWFLFRCDEIYITHRDLDKVNIADFAKLDFKNAKNEYENLAKRHAVELDAMCEALKKQHKIALETVVLRQQKEIKECEEKNGSELEMTTLHSQHCSEMKMLKEHLQSDEKIEQRELVQQHAYKLSKLKEKVASAEKKMMRMELVQHKVEKYGGDFDAAVKALLEHFVEREAPLKALMSSKSRTKLLSRADTKASEAQTALDVLKSRHEEEITATVIKFRQDEEAAMRQMVANRVTKAKLSEIKQYWKNKSDLALQKLAESHEVELAKLRLEALQTADVLKKIKKSHDKDSHTLEKLKKSHEKELKVILAKLGGNYGNLIDVTDPEKAKELNELKEIEKEALLQLHTIPDCYFRRPFPLKEESIKQLHHILLFIENYFKNKHNLAANEILKIGKRALKMYRTEIDLPLEENLVISLMETLEQDLKRDENSIMSFDEFSHWFVRTLSKEINVVKKGAKPKFVLASESDFKMRKQIRKDFAYSAAQKPTRLEAMRRCRFRLRIRKMFNTILRKEKQESDTLSLPDLEKLADWVWKNYHPDGFSVTEEERSFLGPKLLMQANRNYDQRMDLDDFFEWFDNRCNELSRVREVSSMWREKRRLDFVLTEEISDVKRLIPMSETNEDKLKKLEKLLQGYYSRQELTNNDAGMKRFQNDDELKKLEKLLEDHYNDVNLTSSHNRDQEDHEQLEKLRLERQLPVQYFVNPANQKRRGNNEINEEDKEEQELLERLRLERRLPVRYLMNQKEREDEEKLQLERWLSLEDKKIDKDVPKTFTIEKRRDDTSSIFVKLPTSAVRVDNSTMPMVEMQCSNNLVPKIHSLDWHIERLQEVASACTDPNAFETITPAGQGSSAFLESGKPFTRSNIMKVIPQSRQNSNESIQSEAIPVKNSLNQRQSTEKSDKTFNFDEKQNLKLKIDSLEAENAVRVVQMIQSSMPTLFSGKRDGEDIEIDINLLDNYTLQELENYVKTCEKQPPFFPRRSQLQNSHGDSTIFSKPYLKNNVDSFHDFKGQQRAISYAPNQAHSPMVVLRGSWINPGSEVQNNDSLTRSSSSPVSLATKAALPFKIDQDITTSLHIPDHFANRSSSLSSVNDLRVKLDLHDAEIASIKEKMSAVDKKRVSLIKRAAEESSQVENEIEAERRSIQVSINALDGEDSVSAQKLQHEWRLRAAVLKAQLKNSRNLETAAIAEAGETQLALEGRIQELLKEKDNANIMLQEAEERAQKDEEAAIAIEKVMLEKLEKRDKQHTKEMETLKDSFVSKIEEQKRKNVKKLLESKRIAQLDKEKFDTKLAASEAKAESDRILAVGKVELEKHRMQIKLTALESKIAKNEVDTMKKIGEENQKVAELEQKAAKLRKLENKNAEREARIAHEKKIATDLMNSKIEKHSIAKDRAEKEACALRRKIETLEERASLMKSLAVEKEELQRVDTEEKLARKDAKLKKMESLAQEYADRDIEAQKNAKSASESLNEMLTARNHLQIELEAFKTKLEATEEKADLIAKVSKQKAEMEKRAFQLKLNVELAKVQAVHAKQFETNLAEHEARSANKTKVATDLLSNEIQELVKARARAEKDAERVKGELSQSREENTMTEQLTAEKFEIERIKLKEKILKLSAKAEEMKRIASLHEEREATATKDAEFSANALEKVRAERDRILVDTETKMERLKSKHESVERQAAALKTNAAENAAKIEKLSQENAERELRAKLHAKTAASSINKAHSAREDAERRIEMLETKLHAAVESFELEKRLAADREAEVKKTAQRNAERDAKALKNAQSANEYLKTTLNEQEKNCVEAEKRVDILEAKLRTTKEKAKLSRTLADQNAKFEKKRAKEKHDLVRQNLQKLEEHEARNTKLREAQAELEAKRLFDAKKKLAALQSELNKAKLSASIFQSEESDHQSKAEAMENLLRKQKEIHEAAMEEAIKNEKACTEKALREARSKHEDDLSIQEEMGKSAIMDLTLKNEQQLLEQKEMHEVALEEAIKNEKACTEKALREARSKHEDDLSIQEEMGKSAIMDLTLKNEQQLLEQKEKYEIALKSEIAKAESSAQSIVTEAKAKYAAKWARGKISTLVNAKKKVETHKIASSVAQFHADEAAKNLSKYENEVSMFENEQKRLLSEHSTKHALEVAELKERHERMIANELKQASLRHVKSMRRKSLEARGKVAEIQVLKNSQELQYEKALQEAAVKHKNELEAAVATHENGLNAMKLKQERLLSEYSTKHALEVAELEERHERMVANELKQASLRHVKSMRRKSLEAREKVAELKERHERVVANELKQASLRHVKSMRRKSLEARGKVAEIQVLKNSQELQYEKALQEAAVKHENELEAAVATHENALNAMKLKQEAQLQEAVARHNDAMNVYREKSYGKLVATKLQTLTRAALKSNAALGIAASKHNIEMENAAKAASEKVKITIQEMKEKKAAEIAKVKKAAEIQSKEFLLQKEMYDDELKQMQNEALERKRLIMVESEVERDRLKNRADDDIPSTMVPTSASAARSFAEKSNLSLELPGGEKSLKRVTSRDMLTKMSVGKLPPDVVKTPKRTKWEPSLKQVGKIDTSRLRIFNKRAGKWIPKRRVSSGDTPEKVREIRRKRRESMHRALRLRKARAELGVATFEVGQMLLKRKDKEEASTPKANVSRKRVLTEPEIYTRIVKRESRTASEDRHDRQVKSRIDELGRMINRRQARQHWHGVKDVMKVRQIFSSPNAFVSTPTGDEGDGSPAAKLGSHHFRGKSSKE